MTDDTVTLTIDVSNEDIAYEVALGIWGRAMDIHDNPDDDFEHVAEELREIGDDLIDQYEN